MARQLNLSNDSCLFCSDRADPIKNGFVDDRGDPIILDDENVKAKVLKALCNHLMPQNLVDIPLQFSEGMFPFCASCKDLVTELWECQEVIRKTQLRLTELTTTIEKKVVEGVVLELERQMSSSSTALDKRFIKLRDVILKHYREALIIKRKEKLTPTHLVTSSPISVILDGNTAEDDRVVTISSLTKCELDLDVNEARNECAEPTLPRVSIFANGSNQKISQSLFDNDSLFEEEQRVLKSELQSESEMEDIYEDKTSDSGGEAKDQSCVSQVVTSASPPGPSKPLRKTRRRMSDTGRSTQSSMAAPRNGPGQNVTEIRGTFEGTVYEILKNKKTKCGCCSHIYSDINAFKRHVRKQSHQCSVCKKIFTQAYHLKAHHYKFHGAGVNEKFPCPRCGYQYSRRYELNVHLRNGCWRRTKMEMQ